MKLDAVTKYLEGSCSTESIAQSLGTNGSRIIEWATIYQSLGAEGLLKTTQKLSSYSAETKCSAICDYLSGKGTLREIQKKYGIRSDKRPVQTKNPTRNCVPLSKMPMRKGMGFWDTGR